MQARSRNTFLSRSALVTNLCLVHRHRGTLPKRRARLYQECIDVLLEHWQTAKGLQGMDAQQARRVLKGGDWTKAWFRDEQLELINENKNKI